MSAKFPRGGGAGPFLARSLKLLAESRQSLDVFIKTYLLYAFFTF